MEVARPVVLILDDDVSIRRSMWRLLRSVSLDVEVFASAGELLGYQRPARPACLVLDIYLPDMNGLDLLGRLATTDPELPVVVITGHVDETLGPRALRAGATAFLTKPYDEQVLLEAIRAALFRPVCRPRHRR